MEGCPICNANTPLLCNDCINVCQIRSRNSDRGNGSHKVSLPMILKRIKVSQMLRSLYISLLLVPIL